MRSISTKHGIFMVRKLNLVTSYLLDWSIHFHSPCPRVQCPLTMHRPRASRPPCLVTALHLYPCPSAFEVIMKPTLLPLLFLLLQLQANHWLELPPPYLSTSPISFSITLERLHICVLSLQSTDPKSNNKFFFFFCNG